MVYDQRRKGRDITTLSLGEAFFDIPAFDFEKLDFVRGYHYSDSRGIPELRKKIAEYYDKYYAAHINPDDEILISAGSKPVIFFAMQAILNPGDEILIHEPAWLSYQEQARLLDAEPRFISYDCAVDDFYQHFTTKTRIVVINNPNNPAGRIYTKAELESLYRQCRSRGIYVLVDEAYSDFVISDEFYSMTRIAPDKDGIIVVNSLSKNLGMSGWRVGYVISAAPLVDEILKLNQHIITCAPTILQFYMARYFDDVLKVTLPQVTDTVEKRERVAADLDKIGLKRMSGNSTFYFMVNIDPFPGTSLEFALHMLLNHQIAVVPGSAYGDSTARYIRLGIGAETEERIHTALNLIKDAIHLNRFDSDQLYDQLAQEKISVFRNN
ncbi:aspartate/methionine/tyrosine aminotransferase [Bradyrhizobium sp. USDA 10063]